MPCIQYKVGNEGGNSNSAVNGKILNKMAETCSNMIKGLKGNVSEFKTPKKTGFLKV